jgi:hypothetical protein
MEVGKVSKAFSNLLKYIDKLPHTQTEQVYQRVRCYVDPASSAGGHLINEMRETRFKEGFECQIVHPNTLFGSGNIMVGNGINVNVVEKPLPIPLTLSCFVLEKPMSG